MSFSLLKATPTFTSICLDAKTENEAIQEAYKMLLESSCTSSDAVEEKMSLMKETMKSASNFISLDLPYFVAANFDRKVIFVTERLFEPDTDGYNSSKKNVKAMIAQAHIENEIFPDSDGKYKFRVSFQKEQLVNAGAYANAETTNYVQQLCSEGKEVMNTLKMMAGFTDRTLPELLEFYKVDNLEKMTLFLESDEILPRSFNQTVIALTIMSNLEDNN